MTCLVSVCVHARVREVRKVRKQKHDVVCTGGVVRPRGVSTYTADPHMESRFFNSFVNRFKRNVTEGTREFATSNGF